MDEDYDVRGVPLIRTTNHIPYNPLKRPRIGYRNAILALVICIILTVAAVKLSGFLFGSVENGIIYQILSVFFVVFFYK